MDIKVVSQGGQGTLEGYSAIKEVEKAKDKDVVQAVTSKEKVYNEEDLKKAVEEFNGILKSENTQAIYEKHEFFGDTMIKIIDTETKEVILEVPPKKILDMVAKMCELVGVGVDTFV